MTTTTEAIRTTNTRPTLYDRNAVLDALEVIVGANVTELRALNATVRGDRYPTTYSGYFNTPELLAGAVEEITSADGIYITLNPVNSALLARSQNRLRKPGKGELTSDSNITRRMWLPIDCDAIRPSGISASDSEHKAARKRLVEVCAYLHDLGFPEPIIADSGNGGHALYPVDLPADDGGLIENCQKALAARFTDNVVKVDSGVHNQARIWKLYGTRACKGDDTADRPHCMSAILSQPDIFEDVPIELLQQLAAEAPAEVSAAQHNGTAQLNGSLPTFDVQAFIDRNHLDVSGPAPCKGGTVWTLNKSPLCDHGGDGVFIRQHDNGAIGAGCHHDSCSWTWHDLRQAVEPKAPYSNAHDKPVIGKPGTPVVETAQPIRKYKFAELAAAFPTLNKPLVDGMFRVGETVNLIANPKVGKSWLAYHLALSIITGGDWLGFQTRQGKVLFIDNELHPQTLAVRIPKVADALGLFPADYQHDLEVWPLRGNLRSLNRLLEEFEQLERGEFKAVVLDAKYRFGNGESENDNAAETRFYNDLDRAAEMMGAAVIGIHHASKGSQSDKRITDVGSGAGAQSRAADCHIVLREHETDGVMVLDAAVRSFPPVDPVAVSWDFHLWRLTDADTALLKGRKTAQEQRQDERDKQGIDAIAAALLAGKSTIRTIRAATGFSKYKVERLLDKLTATGQVTVTEATIKGNLCNEFSLTEQPE